jgi:acetyl-CoA C-acetyltransferase
LTAIEAGKFKDEIISIKIKKDEVFDTDENPRQTNIEKLARLRPVFKDDGLVTAATASGINDGAAALLLARSDQTKEKPLAYFVDYAVAGLDPA